ncbi:MAG: hypothetical protein ACR2OH_01835 [Microthrixaceae bacterium]
MRTVLAITLATLLAFAGACSSDDDADSADSSSTTAAESASGGSDGSTSALPPVIVDTADDVELTVGEFIDITTLEADKATSSDQSVLEATDAYTDGSAEFNAGAEAKSAGTAVLSVYDGDSILYEVNVTVTD